MSSDPSSSSQSGSRSAFMVRGARLALMGRAGALIEILSLFLFAQMYGSQTYGLFLVLWFIVQALSIFSDFGMTLALQRFVPADDDKVNAGRILKYALSISLGISFVVALAMTLSAPALASLLNANERDSLHLVGIIQLYAWAIPLWCLIDVTTAAIRARRVFGPEIKVRVFYEQGFRLVFGIIFYFLGYLSYGLFISHLIGLILTAGFALRLIDRYYGLYHLFAKTGRDKALVRQMLTFASSMVLPNLARKWHSGLPLLVLNVMIPGAQGAEAAGIYGVARKLASFINVFRESLEYVLAPLASENRSMQDKGQLLSMFQLATRLSLSLVIPAATLIIFFRSELMRQSGSEFLAGSVVILILASGRMFEAASGPCTSILAMIGKYRLPLINAIIGIAITATLAVWLVPQPELFGGGTAGHLAGAALAAAVGINATSIAAHLEVRFLHDLHPYSRSILQPFVVSLGVSVILAVVITQTADVWRPLHFAIGIIGFVGSLAFLVRFGFRRTDAEMILPNKLKNKYPFLLPPEASSD
jgi:O-antigen/teichoic acid export membrane protein